MDAYKLMKELRVNYEQEVFYLPKETGLVLIESSTRDESRISAKCRDVQVEDLWSLTSFFGYSTQTFVLAVNLLDRFLALMRIQPKHLSCVSLSCLHMAAKVTEEECDVTSSDELIRIGQARFTASDLCRMEKIVSEKLDFKSKPITALTFLQLYHQIALSHSMDRKETLSLEKLEAQLKACLCRISFSKAKPSVLALSLLRLQIIAVQSEDMLEIASHIQRHLKVHDTLCDALRRERHTCGLTGKGTSHLWTHWGGNVTPVDSHLHGKLKPQSSSENSPKEEEKALRSNSLEYDQFHLSPIQTSDQL